MYRKVVPIHLGSRQGNASFAPFAAPPITLVGGSPLKVIGIVLSDGPLLRRFLLKIHRQEDCQTQASVTRLSSPCCLALWVILLPTSLNVQYFGELQGLVPVLGSSNYPWRREVTPKCWATRKRYFESPGTWFSPYRPEREVKPK